jgi:hypothetical protein
MDELDELMEFNQSLLDGTSVVGQIISPKSIRESSQYLENVQYSNMVTHGAAVRVDTRKV